MKSLAWYRISLSVFAFGLVMAGVTAFPLMHEVSILASWLGIPDGADYRDLSGLRYWIGFVHEGLRETYAEYPFVAYGTDWLAFGHLVIAMFFIGPFVDPVRDKWVLHVGIVACIAVLPLALICGPIRGIPLYWQLIDCSFGILGIAPLALCLWLTPRIEKAR